MCIIVGVGGPLISLVDSISQMFFTFYFILQCFQNKSNQPFEFQLQSNGHSLRFRIKMACLLGEISDENFIC